MDSMRDFENYLFVGGLGKLIEKKRQEFEGVYVVNPENCQRFVTVHEYFSSLAKNNDGRVTYSNCEPSAIHADLTVEIPSIDLCGEKMKEFAKIIGMVDVLLIETNTKDMVKIDVSVNYVWEAIKKP